MGQDKQNKNKNMMMISKCLNQHCFLLFFVRKIILLLLLLSVFVFHSVFGQDDIYVTDADHTIRNQYELPLPYTYTTTSELPISFHWGNVNGRSYLTKSLNQHIPQYCGSCWAHSSLSSLSDRIKMMKSNVIYERFLYQGQQQKQQRKEQELLRFDHPTSSTTTTTTTATTTSCTSLDDINLSVQFLLNCGTDVAGSCLGGSGSGAYQFIYEYGYIPYDTCQPYLACSNDSHEGFCSFIDTTCQPQNICRTCSSSSSGSTSSGSSCEAVIEFPNATIQEYGTYINHEGSNSTGNDTITFQIMSEIYHRGPVKASIFAEPLKQYTGGILWDTPTLRMNVTKHNHGVSIVGWGYDDDNNEEDIIHDDNNKDFDFDSMTGHLKQSTKTNTKKKKKQYWIVRNSWGQYWGEMGYFRIELGSNLLLIETNIAWATPGSYSEWYVHVPPTTRNDKDVVVKNNNEHNEYNTNTNDPHRSLRQYDYVDPSVYYSRFKSS